MKLMMPFWLVLQEHSALRHQLMQSLPARHLQVLVLPVVGCFLHPIAPPPKASCALLHVLSCYKEQLPLNRLLLQDGHV